MRNRINCSKCGNKLEDRRIGKQSYCLSCHNDYIKSRKVKKYSELTNTQRKKAITRACTSSYIKRGKIKKQPCEKCGDEKVECHHLDYNDPLMIVWLCRKHHRELHGQQIR